MKSLASWLLAFFIVIFWGFRVVVTLSAQFGGDFGGFIVYDNITEIIMLFVTIVCFILIVKRNIFGGILYLVGYGYYFGSYVYNEVLPILTEGEILSITISQNMMVGAIAIILGLCVVLNIAVEKIRSKHFTDSETDWYFNNKDYDRKMDERADKNQYRTL